MGNYSGLTMQTPVVPNRLVIVPASMIIQGLEGELTESLTMERRIVISDAIDYIKRHSKGEER